MSGSDTGHIEVKDAAGGAVVEALKKKDAPTGWARFRDRATSVALAMLLLAFGLAAGPMASSLTPPEPPRFAPSAAVLQPMALKDAPVAAEGLHQKPQTVRLAASLRRLVPPTTPIEILEAPVSTETHPSPEVEVTVDISDQRATVIVNGVQTGYYKVSTGLGRDWTPTGTFPPKWLNRHHRSSIYNNAPMPYSVFFNGNIALHGTNHIRKLGRPASKGCVRMHPANARKIFNLIYRHGRDKVQITVQD